MPYKPQKPKQLGLQHFRGVDLREIVPFIHWAFFFVAWRLNGKYDGIETLCECPACKAEWLQKFPEDKKEKAEEAYKLFRDAQEMLRRFLDEDIIKINASVGIFPARSQEDDILVDVDGNEVILPMLRQQHTSSDGYCYSLADYLSEESDYIGVFATTVLGVEDFAATFEQEDDMYHSILVKTISDRLAEATAEWLHYKVRKEIWGYAADEEFVISNFHKSQFTGIRPAVGYPSLPDQSLIFEMDKLIHFNQTGIKLTENGAMFPNASVSGLYFAHPQSRYFMLGKIDESQLNDYAKRRNKSPQEMKKWLASNI